MYAVPNVNRVYISFLLLLCAAFLFAPSLANANEYWSVLEKRWIPSKAVTNDVKQMLGHKVSRPSGTSISTASTAPTISKNALGGLSATTNNILKTLDQPSNFNATSNYSAQSAKNALKSCVRSTACVGRALGAGAIIYEGIQAWKEVYDIIVDNNGTPMTTRPEPAASTDPNGYTCSRQGIGYSSCQAAYSIYTSQFCAAAPSRCPTSIDQTSHSSWTIKEKEGYVLSILELIPNSCVEGAVLGFDGCQTYKEVPFPYEELDQMIQDAYEPEPSDAPIVLLSDSFNSPQSITLSNPEPAQLPSTTSTNTDSQGKTTTSVTNKTITYNILNNNSSSPSIESSINESTTTYDDTANIIGTSTSTTTHTPIPSDVPTSGASADLEFPAFCTWAKPLCDWLNWTQEPLEDEEPDLTQLITDFEPDEDGFDLGIGSGSCPEPIQLNLAFIDKTVEVKYDPFCDFLGMIKPFVLAAAYLFAAYLYLGVLRRG